MFRFICRQLLCRGRAAPVARLLRMMTAPVAWRAPSVPAVLLGVMAMPASSQDEPRPYTVVGDSIPASLTGKPGDAQRGRALVANRTVGLCLLCHSGPIPEEHFQGNLAPSLAGAGPRWSEGHLRLRLVDAPRLNPDTIMPPYFPFHHPPPVAKP